MSVEDKPPNPAKDVQDVLGGPADATVDETLESSPLPSSSPSLLARAVQFLGRVIHAYERDDVPLLSAAIAFYGLLAVAPIVILALTIADALTVGERVQRDISAWLTEHVSADVALLIDDWVAHYHDADDTTLAVAFSAVVLIVSATRLFTHIRTALDRIWHIKSAPPDTFLGLLWTRVLGLGIVGLLGLLVLAGIATKVLLHAASDHLGFEGIPFLWMALDWSIYFMLVGGLVYVIYRRLPNAEVPRQHAQMGAALTALLLIVGGELIAFYLSTTNVTSTFGAAGSTMALVLWVYYATQVFLVGAIATWLFAEKGAKLRRRSRLLRKRRHKSPRKNKQPKAKPTPPG